MARIKCEIEYDLEENEYGTESPSVRATCSKCGHEIMSYGDSDSSLRRCLAKMNEECPEGENNFYIEE